MVLSTSFTCPNGHNFSANAKLRARCPECGAMARKAFGQSDPKPTSDPSKPEEDVKPEPEPTLEPKEKVKEKPEPKPKARVLRRGKMAAKKTTIPEPPKKNTIVARRAIPKSKRAVPVVRTKPKGTREHKIAVAGVAGKPYREQMRERNWF